MVLLAFLYQSIMPVDKRQAWTAEQKWYANELKRKSLDKITSSQQSSSSMIVLSAHRFCTVG
jgi:hypothetical protein